MIELIIKEVSQHISESDTLTTIEIVLYRGDEMQ